jgi:uncharacterized SAM-binding protein YcdF (DUF218 family)
VAFVRTGWRIVQGSLAALGALMVIVTVAPPRWYVNWLTGEWSDKKGPVLIVLGGDALDGTLLGEGSYWRTIYAIRAWREGGFRHVILSGAAPITQPMRDYLVCQGVPQEAITVEGRSTSTRENALFTAPIARQMAGPYVLLSSDIHMRRAVRAFHRAGLDVIPRPAPDAGKRLNNWRLRWLVFLELLTETGKNWYYALRAWI